MTLFTRRRFLAGSVAAGMGYLFAKAPGFEKNAESDKALVAITLDLEIIGLATVALMRRVVVDPAGLRMTVGFANVLADRPDLQQMLIDSGLTWASRKYPAQANSKRGEELNSMVYFSIVKAQEAAQP